MQQKYLTFHVHLSPVFRNVVHRFPCIFKRFDQSLYERTLIQFANIPTCIFLLTLQHPDNFLDQTHFWRIQILAFFPCCKKASVVHNEHLSVIFQALVCSKNSRTLLLALSNAKKMYPPFVPSLVTLWCPMMVPPSTPAIRQCGYGTAIRTPTVPRHAIPSDSCASHRSVFPSLFAIAMARANRPNSSIVYCAIIIDQVFIFGRNCFQNTATQKYILGRLINIYVFK